MYTCSALRFSHPCGGLQQQLNEKYHLIGELSVKRLQCRREPREVSGGGGGHERCAHLVLDKQAWGVENGGYALRDIGQQLVKFIYVTFFDAGQKLVGSLRLLDAKLAFQPEAWNLHRRERCRGVEKGREREKGGEAGGGQEWNEFCLLIAGDLKGRRADGALSATKRAAV